MTSRTSITVPFLLGALTSLFVTTLIERRRKVNERRNAGATPEANDLSLFYGNQAALTTVTERQRFLDANVYGALVRDAVVCCVDIVLVRNNDETKRRECLLVERSSEPVKGAWWWPGGRLLKGETFFDAAKRKARQEAGITNVNCIQILGVWNTFFPTSAWDNDFSKGTQTVNAIVLVEIVDPSENHVKLDDTSENYRWISLDADSARANNEDEYVVQALLRLKAWNPNYV
ncbi:hypothetical protein MPSEU_000338600 [Mayamaea pseudoterrestris]|nr:hypothetical protein MPSEU_000338600 [Mayamaea pseudoterrestris]